MNLMGCDVIRLIALWFGLCLLSTSTSFAAPGLINYQGTLTDANGVPISDTVSIEFRLFDTATNGTQLWTETQNVSVQNGTYNVLLGSVGAFPATLFDGDSLWLEVVAAGEVLSPRQRLASVPFAMQAQSVPDGSITNIKIADSTISSSKLVQGPGSGLDAESIGGATLADLDQRYGGGSSSPIQPLTDTGASEYRLAIGGDGLPVVAMLAGKRPAVLHCSDARCTGGNVTYLTEDFRELSGLSLSISNDGFPVISYVATNSLDFSTDLVVAKCTDAKCANFNIANAASQIGVTGYSIYGPTRIAVNSSGNAYVSYFLGNNYDYDRLMLAVCGDPNCITVNALKIIAEDYSPSRELKDAHLAVRSDDMPVVSYILRDGFEMIPAQLKVARCTDSNCFQKEAQIIANSYDYSLKAFGLEILDVPLFFLTIPTSNKLMYCQDASCENVTSYNLAPGEAVTILPDLNAPLLVGPQIIKCLDQNCSQATFNSWIESPLFNFPVDVVEHTDGLPLILYRRAAAAGEGDLALYYCVDKNCSDDSHEGWSTSSNGCLGKRWGKDDDNDGFAQNFEIQSCIQPTDYASGIPYVDYDLGVDCNNSNASIYPGAPDDVCDGVDANCDGADCPGQDIDHDGYPFSIDCDDFNSNAHPGAVEICGNGIDDDCDGNDCSLLDVDADNDGSPYRLDCNDGDASIYPGATEVCGNGIDEDCDSVADSGCDVDGDGYVTGSDCNDNDATVYPTAPEICDGIRNDCSGVISPTEVDLDGDGYVACGYDPGTWKGSLTVVGGDDCNNNNASIFPGAAEVCDGIDNNCNGQVDENCTACADCHLGSIISSLASDDVDSYAWDGIKAVIDLDEWQQLGHGLTTSSSYVSIGHDGSINSGAGFDDAFEHGCGYCHDDTVPHDFSLNYFRLANQSLNPLPDVPANGVCLVCHSSNYAGGYDPDGGGSAYGQIDSTSSNNSYAHHLGTQHGAGNNGGQFCWDCHDPHGDRSFFNSETLWFMVQRNPVVQSDGVQGVPINLVDPSNDGTSGRQVRFNGDIDSTTSGLDRSDYSDPVQGADGGYGICNNCHGTGWGAAFDRDSSVPDHYDGGQSCHECHGHDLGFTPINVNLVSSYSVGVPDLLTFNSAGLIENELAGFTVEMMTGSLAGVSSVVYRNTATTLSVKFPSAPSPGDQFKILKRGTFDGNLLEDASLTLSGVEPTWPQQPAPPIWDDSQGAPSPPVEISWQFSPITEWNPVSSVSSEGSFCIKCHSAYSDDGAGPLPQWPRNTASGTGTSTTSTWSDSPGSPVVESDKANHLNPNNLSHHPVFARGNNQPVMANFNQPGIVSYHNPNWPVFSDPGVAQISIANGVATLSGTVLPITVLPGWYVYVGSDNGNIPTGVAGNSISGFLEIVSIVDDQTVNVRALDGTGGWTTSIDLGPTANWFATAGLGNDFLPPWGPWSTMRCTDCHQTEGLADNMTPPHFQPSVTKYRLKSVVDSTFLAWNGSSVSTVSSSSGDSHNVCLNCHRNDVYGEYAMSVPLYANWSRRGLNHDAVVSSFRYNSYRPKSGIVCMNCHGGARLGSIHGSNLGRGYQGIAGSPSGRGLLNGAAQYGFTRSSTTQNGVHWMKGSSDTVNNFAHSFMGVSHSSSATYDYP